MLKKRLVIGVFRRFSFLPSRRVLIYIITHSDVCQYFFKKILTDRSKNNLTIRLLIAPLIRFKTMAARINLRMIEIGFAVSLSDDSASRTQIDKIIGKI